MNNMPKKKKGLGRDIDKSMVLMDETIASLRNFANMPLKEGLRSNGVSDEPLSKKTNDALEKAFMLINVIKDLKEKVKGVKVISNSRFAANVVARFIEDSSSDASI